MAKTLRSRIAAVAVVALGAGLVQATPALAVTTALGTISMRQGGDIVARAATTGTVDLRVPTAGDDPEFGVAVRVDSRPATAVAGDVEVGDVFGDVAVETAAGATTGLATITLGAAKTAVTSAACTNGNVGSEFTINSMDPNAGQFSLHTTADNGLLPGDIIKLSDDLVYDGSGFLSEGTILTVLAVLDARTFIIEWPGLGGDTPETSTGKFYKQGKNFTAGGVKTLGGEQISDAGDTPTYQYTGVCDNGLTRSWGTASATADYFSTAGSYGLTVWYDEDGDGVKDPEELVAKTYTLIVGGTPTSVTVSPMQSTVIANYEYLDGVRVTLKDALGNITKLAGVETLDMSGTGLTYDDGSLTSLASLTTYYQDYFRTAEVNGTYTLKATFGGATNVSGTASVVAVVTTYINDQPYDIEVLAGTKGVTDKSKDAYSFPGSIRFENEEDESDYDIYADPITARKITFRVFGQPGKYVGITIGGISSNSTMSLAPSTYNYIGKPYLLNADGYVDVPVNPTAVANGDSYYIQLATDGDNGIYTYVTYESAEVNTNTITVTEIPTENVTNMLTAVGGTSSFNVTVADQYNNRYAGYTVRLATDADQRNASAQIDAVTNTSGEATVSLKDAGTTASKTTDAATQDVVGIEVYVPNNNTTDLKTSLDSVTIFYDSKIAGSFVATGGTNSQTEWKAYVGAYCSNCTVPRAGSRDIDAGNGTLGSRDDSLVPVDTLLRNATLVPVTGYGVKYTAVTEGLRFITTSNSGRDYYEDATSTLWWDGSRVFAVAAKTGVNEFTVSSAGYTQTIKFTAYTHSDFARTVSLVAPTATAAPGAGLEFKASVLDGFGNAVPNSYVLFTVTGGRSLSGASGAEVPTGSNGIASLQVTADAVGAVAVDVAISGGQTEVRAGFPVNNYPTVASGGFPAGSKAASKTGTIAGKTAAEIAAEAAAAEAAKTAAAIEAAKTAAAADAAKNAAAIEAAKAAAAADNAKTAAAVAAVAATITGVQTAISTLVASTTATLTAMTAKINKIMKKLKI